MPSSRRCGVRLSWAGGADVRNQNNRRCGGERRVVVPVALGGEGCFVSEVRGPIVLRCALDSQIFLRHDSYVN
jgi:hypothetical protein